MSEERAKDRWRRKVDERAKERAGEKRRQLEERAKMLKEKLVSGNPKRNVQRSPSPPGAPKKMPRKLEAKPAEKNKDQASSSASSQAVPVATTERDLMKPGSTHEARVAHYTLGHYGMNNGHRIMYYNKDGSFSRSADEDMG